MIKSSLPSLGCHAIQVGTATCSIFVIFFKTRPFTGDDEATSNSTSVRSSDIERSRGYSFSPTPKITRCKKWSHGEREREGKKEREGEGGKRGREREGERGEERRERRERERGRER